jgi:hypothetical protein
MSGDLILLMQAYLRFPITKFPPVWFIPPVGSVLKEAFGLVCQTRIQDSKQGKKTTNF